MTSLKIQLPSPNNKATSLVGSSSYRRPFKSPMISQTFQLKSKISFDLIKLIDKNYLIYFRVKLCLKIYRSKPRLIRRMIINTKDTFRVNRILISGLATDQSIQITRIQYLKRISILFCHLTPVRKMDIKHKIALNFVINTLELKSILRQIIYLVKILE